MILLHGYAETVIAGARAAGPRLGQQMRLVAADVGEVLLADTGHWVLDERPSETENALGRFL